MSKTLSLLAAMMLAGCGISVGEVTEDNYAEKSAQVTCAQMKECFRALFDAEFDDIADCEDELTGDNEDAMEEMDDLGCDFDEEEAQSCLDASAALTCEDQGDIFTGDDNFDDCDDVWDCE